MALPSTGITANLNGAMVFSPLSEWNIRIDHASLADNSSKIIAAISPDSSLRPDFGSGSWQGKGIGIPYIVVDKGGAGAPITHHWPDEAEAGPYPIPGNAPIEGGGDHHVIVLERDPSAWNGLGKLYEIWDAKQTGSGWTGQGAVFDMARGDLQRPEGWTSADAAGLPVFPGLARHDEMER